MLKQEPINAPCLSKNNAWSQALRNSVQCLCTPSLYKIVELPKESDHNRYVDQTTEYYPRFAVTHVVLSGTFRY